MPRISAGAFAAANKRAIASNIVERLAAAAAGGKSAEIEPTADPAELDSAQPQTFRRLHERFSARPRLDKPRSNRLRSEIETRGRRLGAPIGSANLACATYATRPHESGSAGASDECH